MDKPKNPVIVEAYEAVMRDHRPFTPSYISRLPPEHPNCPPRHGNCTCICHVAPGTMHIMACCGFTTAEPDKELVDRDIIHAYVDALPGAALEELLETLFEMVDFYSNKE